MATDRKPQEKRLLYWVGPNGGIPGCGMVEKGKLMSEENYPVHIWKEWQQRGWLKSKSASEE